MTERTPSEYRVFRKTTVAELLDEIERGEIERDAFVYIYLPSRMAHSRKEAIRDQAKADESDGVPYAAAAKGEITEHAPRKKISYE